MGDNARFNTVAMCYTVLEGNNNAHWFEKCEIQHVQMIIHIFLILFRGFIFIQAQMFLKGQQEAR